MRLDKWLQTSRLVKRRALAKELCDGGRVRIAGRIAKAGAEIAVGDVLDVDYGWRRLTVRVLDVDPHPRSKSAAAELYAVLGEERPGSNGFGVEAPRQADDAEPRGGCTDE